MVKWDVLSPTHIRSLPPEVEKGGNGQKDEAGLDEGCIVDQDVDVSDKEVKQ